MSRPSAVEDEALRRYVRARAPDFGAAERRDLDAWLAADARHREEYARLDETWRQLDGLAEHMHGLRPATARVKHSSRSPPHWLVGGLVSAGLAFALFLAIQPEPAAPRHFATTVAQHRVVKLPEGIEVTLNADTEIDVLDGKAPRIDLTRGDIYVDVATGGSQRLEVRAGGASIRDIGTRFSVAVADQGGSVVVEQGQVELRAGPAYLMVHAGRGVDFDAAGGVRERQVPENAVAPWRGHRWQFKATSLAILVREMARQQRIQVDIPEPAVAALTVSGSFGFEEPERVLWAAAQVHGLALRRLGERHFQLGHDPAKTR
jgi:transmembrane sensor